MAPSTGTVTAAWCAAISASTSGAASSRNAATAVRRAGASVTTTMTRTVTRHFHAVPLLRRHTGRGFNTSSRLAISSGHSSRNAAPTPASSTTTTTTTTTTVYDAATLPPSAPPPEAAAAPRQFKTPVEQAKLLLKWHWLEQDDARRSQLLAYVGSSTASASDVSAAEEAAQPPRVTPPPEWLPETFEIARSFRSVRSRLWVPEEALESDEGAHDWLEKRIAQHAEQLRERALEDVRSLRRRRDQAGAEEAERRAAEQQREWQLSDREEQLDVVLRDDWLALPAEKRRDEMLRVRFECARRLGWRKGYTAGYPTPRPSDDAPSEEERRNLASLVKRTDGSGEDAAEAWLELADIEEERAWRAWRQLEPLQRKAEERAAWALRDRSRVYVDDSSTSIILGASAPRWYAQPQRAGPLCFLPNETVRLVRNFVPAGQPYDAWKATFRVPLSMHKHGVRAYLLAIYGLRTTWIRSMIYRSALRRSRFGNRLTAKGLDRRTFKKVEVGLLEPFVFPEITQQFKRQNLMDQDLEYERMRMLMKATGARRWRGRRPVLPRREEEGGSASLIEGARAMVTRHFDGTRYANAPARDDEEGGEEEKASSQGDDKAGKRGQKSDDAGGKGASSHERPDLLVRGGMLPSRRHSHILRVLSETRRREEIEVERRVAEMRAQQANAGGAGGRGRK